MLDLFLVFEYFHLSSIFCRMEWIPLIGLLLFVTSVAFAQKKDVIFYLNLIKQEKIAEVKKAGHVYNYSFRVTEKDVPNGYVSYIEHEADGPSSEMVLWRLKNGNDLIAISSRACGPECYQEIESLEFKGSKRTQVTKATIPTQKVEAYAKTQQDKLGPSDQYLVWYVLPRVGRNIQVILEGGEFSSGNFPPAEKGITWRVIGDLQFNGQTFDFVKQ